MFEFDRSNLSIDSETGLILIDDDSVAAILDPKLDVTEKFGLEEKGLKASDVTFSVVVYSDWSLMTAQFSSYEGGGEEHIGYEPSEAERKLLWELLEEYSQQHYGCSLKEYPQYALNANAHVQQEVTQI